MCYEDAAATKMLATRCAACGRKLVDATSVEASLGPICREQYYYEDALPITPQVLGRVTAALLGVEDPEVREKVGEAVQAGDSRRAANLLVYHIALLQKDPAAFPMIRAIKALGYEALADRIEERLSVKITLTLDEDSGELTIKTPYHPAFVAAIKTVKGRKFDVDDKSWSVPYTARKAVWAALQAAFPGEDAVGPQGPFTITD